MRQLLKILFFVVILSFGAVAQTFVVPSSWRESSIDASWEQCNATTTTAIQRVLDALGSGKFADDAFYSILATFDGYTGQRAYEKNVLDYFFANGFAAQPFVDFTISHGLSALYGSATYGGGNLLSVAVESWEYARRYTISDEEAASGSSAVKNYTLTGQCDNVSMAGGTFWKTDPNDSLIMATSTALFFALSALLANVTSNSTYQNAARQSGTFMLTNVDVGLPGNGKGALDSRNNQSCLSDSFGDGTFQIDSAGIFLEGLAYLDGDETLGSSSVDSLRADIVNTTLTMNRLCNETDGVINTQIAGGSGGNRYLVQGLGSLYHRGLEPSDLSKYVEQYLAVQFNSILDLSSSNALYSGSWSGPGATSYDQGNQTLALFGLVNAAQTVFQDQAITNGTGGGNGTSPDGQGHQGGTSNGSNASNRTGAIAGGVVGGIAFIGIIALGVFLGRRRRRRQQQRDAAEVAVDEPFPPVPFVTQGGPVPVASLPQRKGHRRRWSQRSSSNVYSSGSDPTSIEPRSTSGSSSRNTTQLSTDQLVQLLADRMNQGQILEGFAPPPAYVDGGRVEHRESGSQLAPNRLNQ